jgi:hypothetical protein
MGQALLSIKGSIRQSFPEVSETIPGSSRTSSVEFPSALAEIVQADPICLDKSGRDRVAVMQPTQSRQGDDLVITRNNRGRHSTARCVLLQSEMSADFVVIAHVVFQQRSATSF